MGSRGTNSQWIRMVVLIWMILLFTAKSSNTDAGETSEILAEAGLCIVIPCHLSAESDFILESAAWYKCKDTCTDSNVILYLNNTDKKAESGLHARVSLLEPDLSQRNCSIIINDLSKSDSGLYQLRVINQTMKANVSHEANVTVKDLTQKPTLAIPSLTEGQETTLTCTAPRLCSGSAPKITWLWRKTGENNSHIPGNITDFQTGNLTGVPQRHGSTLTFNPSAEHHGSTVTCRVSFTGNTITEETVALNVTYVRTPEITGETTVKQGGSLNLTCSVESFPVSSVSWTQVPSSNNLYSQPETDLRNNIGTATLFFSNVTTEHTGQYICTVKNMTKTVFVTVTLYPKIPNSSDVECVSHNENGEVKKEEAEEEEEEGHIMKVLRIVSQLEVIIAFLLGCLLSTIICCLARKCCRKKKIHRNVAETLEMVTSHQDPLTDASQAAEGDQDIDQEAAEPGGAAAVGKSDVEYSNLDFSQMKRQHPEEAGTTQETTETEYAEIKKEKVEERQDGEGEEEEEELMGKDEETKPCVPDEEEAEDVALYSTVKDVMEEVQD